MPVPKEWSTLEDTQKRLRESRSLLFLPNLKGSPRESVERVIADLSAAEWAVTVRPQLEALVAKWRSESDEYAATAILGKVDLSAIDGCADELERLIATPHEEHEETR